MKAPRPLCLPCLLSLAALAGASQSTSSILEALLADYDSLERPSALGGRSSNVSDRASVNIGIEALRVDQKTKLISIDGYIRCYWRDPRLQFPEGVKLERLDLPSTNVNGRQLWTPSIFIQNAVVVRMVAMADEKVWIERDGSIFWSRGLHLEMSCESFSYGQAPWDTQYCHMAVSVYRYEATQVEISWHKEGIDIIDRDKIQAGEWTVDIAEVRTVTRKFISGSYRYAQACFRLRRSSFFFPGTMLIALLLVVATYSGLFVSHEAAPARVSLAFLCFLMVITNFNAVQGRLPAGSTQTRIWVLDFFLGTMCFNFLLLLEYAVVNFLAARKRRQAAEERAFELEVKRVFDACDVGRSGSLDAEGVRTLCGKLHMGLEDSEVAGLMELADSSGNGLLEFNELLAALGRLPCRGGSERQSLQASVVGREVAEEIADEAGHSASMAHMRSTASHAVEAAERRIHAVVMHGVVHVTDARCRWLFPSCYGAFLGVLALCWPFYEHLETCDYS